MLYFIGWSLFFVFFKIYFNFKVIGRNNIPSDGAFIIASNHASYLDPILLGISLHRALNYMARENLFRRRFSDFIMRSVHAFPVKRNDSDYGAMRKALSLLEEGKPLVIFPEGTRSKDKELRKGKPGIGFMAVRSGVPVVPAYVGGSFDALPRGVKTLRRQQVKIYIGKPVIFGKGRPGAKDRRFYEDTTDEIMKKIAELKNIYESSFGR